MRSWINLMNELHGPCPTCGKCMCCDNSHLWNESDNIQIITTSTPNDKDIVISRIHSLLGRVRIDGSAHVSDEEIEKIIYGTTDKSS